MTKFSENFTYKIDGKKVDSVGEFYFLTQGNKYIISIDGLEVNAKGNHLKYVSAPFFLDEVTTGFSSFSPQNKDETEEELLNILLEKKPLSISILGTVAQELNSDWSQNNTGGTVFEKVQDTPTGMYFKFPETEQEKVYKDYKNNSQLQKASNNLDCTLQDRKSSIGVTFNRESLVLNEEDNRKYFDDMNSKIGTKETDNKVDYGELDWDYVDEMALRMSKNLDKYPSKNWQKKMDIKKLAEASIRHARKILQQIDNDEESLEDHAIALGCNGMMINYQLKNK